ncbi:hypothetical protein SARC_12020 [Sphaeroforma arctica JP610]|uniref:Tyr recombinase domain-containing protein n=1 Tax=Sphaeroforma arctica JP610 TaxID=667725 RepID=A0A0L0FFC4_9EUKA|nr:hypothetical protein SARC_12020 [Sphaeroforma arctica JP610]KNC75455.1 hypothetical protein SARC_12020 [Sphaeroforma arctica JP610]|eukprot:XP_014149357.1 hypothetical protein SARC_12020 [Sphaeroforma arctica JP610]
MILQVITSHKVDVVTRALLAFYWCFGFRRLTLYYVAFEDIAFDDTNAVITVIMRHRKRALRTAKSMATRTLRPFAVATYKLIRDSLHKAFIGAKSAHHQFMQVLSMQGSRNLRRLFQQAGLSDSELEHISPPGMRRGFVASAHSLGVSDDVIVAILGV